jgi:acetyltransferase-like isoleucine patch superfamily enzyme
MPRYFSLTALERFRHRKRLRIGPGGRIARDALFSVDRSSHIHIGKDCRIGPGVILATYGGFIEIGDGASINPYSVLYGHGGLRIGNVVSIATHCTVVPANHVFDRTDIPIRRQGLRRQGIVIADDVWIGANAVVLDGARIGEGCVIAAGSVARGELEPMGVYGGVPARRLKTRGDASAPRGGDDMGKSAIALGPQAKPDTSDSGM